MQAIQMSEFGGPEVLQLCQIAQPTPGPGQILIRVESAAVNFADVMRRRNDAYPFPTPLPFIPGGEVAGMVEELGEGVEGPPVGTPVFAVVGGDGSTGYAQFAIADVQQVVPIPPGISTDEAAGIVIAGTSAMLILTDVAELEEGETVLVGGAGGGVGSYAIQIAKARGAGKIIGLASSDSKRALALEAGADSVVDPNNDSWEHEVSALAGDAGVNVVLEMSGGETFARGLRTLGPFGRFVVFGLASGEPGHFDEDAQRALFYTPSLGQSIRVFNLGLYFGSKPMVAVEAMTELIGLVASGAVKVNVGATMPLAEAANAHDLIEKRQTVGKVILKPWQ